MRRRVGRTMAGAGYVEVISFPFVGEATSTRWGWTPSTTGGPR
ncbi:MAG: hypothetical protein R2734_01935 [Nocardioides sp.]